MLVLLFAFLFCASAQKLTFTLKNIHSVNLTGATPVDMQNYYDFVESHLGDEIEAWRKDFDKLPASDPLKLAVVSTLGHHVDSQSSTGSCWGCCGLCEKYLTAGWYAGCVGGGIVSKICGPWTAACAAAFQFLCGMRDTTTANVGCHSTRACFQLNMCDRGC